jgi:hypothetical protein
MPPPFADERRGISASGRVRRSTPHCPPPAARASPRRASAHDVGAGPPAIGGSARTLLARRSSGGRAGDVRGLADAVATARSRSAQAHKRTDATIPAALAVPCPSATNNDPSLAQHRDGGPRTRCVPSGTVPSPAVRPCRARARRRSARALEAAARHRWREQAHQPTPRSALLLAVAVACVPIALGIATARGGNYAASERSRRPHAPSPCLACSSSPP